MNQPSDAQEAEGSRSEGRPARFRTAVFAVAVLTACVAVAAQPQGFQVEVKPLSREQVSAFYGARGFGAGTLRPYADACVLSFTAHNNASTTVRYRLADWRAASDVRFTDVETWENVWKKVNVAEPARIAFRWAQFPAEQEFAAGDWIMGMAALAARPHGAFRVTIRYQDETGRHESTTEPVRCAD